MCWFPGRKLCDAGSLNEPSVASSIRFAHVTLLVFSRKAQTFPLDEYECKALQQTLALGFPAAAQQYTKWSMQDLVTRSSDVDVTSDTLC